MKPFWTMLVAIVACVCSASALAAPPTVVDPGEEVAAKPANPKTDRAQAQQGANEIIVIGDPFARWDGTRWLVQTQVLMPLRFSLYATRNYEMATTAVQIRLVLKCEKTYKHGKRIYDVLCHIEDIGLLANSWYKKHAHAQEVLDELDTLLTGSTLQLRVGRDGTVQNTDLADIEHTEIGARDQYTIRGQTAIESARILLRLTMAAFHLRLPEPNIIKQGTWAEYEPTLFQIPSLTNTMSNAVVLHRYDRWKGKNIVQSKGEGIIRVGWSDDDSTTSSEENLFSCKYVGVATFNDSGVMTERVWAINGVISAGSTIAFGDYRYVNSGRVQILAPDAHPDVGPTGLVAQPGHLPASDEVKWVPIQ